MAETSEGSPSRAESAQQIHDFVVRNVTALEAQIQRANDASLNEAERGILIDEIMSGISNLTKEVQDATHYLPPYDQRAYGTAIKNLQRSLDQIKTSTSRRPKFSFKSKKVTVKPSVATTSTAVAAGISTPSQEPNSYTGSLNSYNDLRSARPSEESDSSAPQTTSNDAPSLARVSQIRVNSEGPSVASTADQSLGSDHLPSTGLRISKKMKSSILLPSSFNTSAGTVVLSEIETCIVWLPGTDLPVKAEHRDSAAKSLIIRDIEESVVVCGIVDGPVHLTRLTNCAVLVACRQFRMHECRNVDVYLHCPSRPIVEAVTMVRFAPVPAEIQDLDSDGSATNRWNDVDDFLWLKSGPSPNWSILPPHDTIGVDRWLSLPNTFEQNLDDVLKDLLPS